MPNLNLFTLNRGPNPNAQFTVGNVVAFADAAGSAPVDGTGGAPTCTIARSVSSPLDGIASYLFTKDAANRQGEGFSTDIALQPSDATKVMSWSFDYQITTGTYTGYQAPPLYSDLTLWIYDVTNSVMYQAAPYQIDGSVSTTNQYSLTTSFQVPVGCLTARLIWFVGNTTANAFTAKFNNISFGRIPGYADGINNSEVYVDSGNGLGSSNTKIRRYSNIRKNVGTAIVYADSSTLGASFTITEPGVYSVGCEDGSTNDCWIGISVDTADGTIAIESLTYAQGARASNYFASAGASTWCGWTGRLSAGAVIRAQMGGNLPTRTNATSNFWVVKVSN